MRALTEQRAQTQCPHLGLGAADSAVQSNYSYARPGGADAFSGAEARARGDKTAVFKRWRQNGKTRQNHL